MSFFSRKPNPALPTGLPKLFAPPPAIKHAINIMNNAGAQTQQSPVAKPEEQQAPSNQRFRSFAERYIVERCRDWKESEIDERAWEAILQARSIYNKVKEVGRTLTNDN